MTPDHQSFQLSELYDLYLMNLKNSQDTTDREFGFFLSEYRRDYLELLEDYLVEATLFSAVDRLLKAAKRRFDTVVPF